MAEPQPSWYIPEAWAVRQACAASPKMHRQAWRTRRLWWKLDTNQWRLHQQLTHNGRKRKLLNCSRRIGKTYMLAYDADLFAWNNPRARIVFAAPTLKDLEDIVLEAFEEYFSDCPEDLRPQWVPSKNRFVYRNGAQIRLVGCDDKRKANRARGRAVHRVYIEEAGSNPVLKYLVHSVLAATLLSTGGEMWLASSPPETEEHEFATMVRAAEAAGTLAHCDIWACPRYTAAEVEDFVRNEAETLGLSVEEYKQTAEYKREFLGHLITDPARAILPAASHERMDGTDGLAPAVVRVMPSVPLFRDRYVSMDLGFHPHFTHLLFGYWDYAAQVLVVEDEIEEQRLNDTKLAHLVGGQRDPKTGELAVDGAGAPVQAGKEVELWGRMARPYLRVADNTYPMTISELAINHGLVFLPTAKDEKEAAILQVNRWLRQGRIAIHPRVKKLIAQVKGGVWNKHRTEFALSPNGGHYDAVDALVYLVRNVIPHMDRVPDGWGIDKENTTWRPRGEVVSPATETLRRVFGGH